MRLPPLPEVSAPVAAGRTHTRITVSEYDPAWPLRYAEHESRIRGVLGERVLALEHVGSTAVPGLAAKDRLDIDLIVADPGAEDDYVAALEGTGCYTLRTRQPEWFGHRCLWTDDHDVNLHVFGPDCDEFLRHLVLRDWLRTHPEDREAYAAAKRRSAEENPWSAADYVRGKSEVVFGILQKAGLS